MKNTQTNCPSILKASQPVQHLWMRNVIIPITMLFLTLVVSLSRATLPDVPRGVSVLNTTDDKALRKGILGNLDIDMISLQENWADIQPTDAPPSWTHFQTTLQTLAQEGNGKSALLRMPTMGGSRTNGGNTPDWVFQAMGIPDPGSTTAAPGTTYSFEDADGTVKCIPVFWQPVYLAKKKALIAMAGAYLATDPNSSILKIFVVSFANATSEDWNVPDAANGDPSQVTLWLNTPGDVPPGAGYTTQLMIDAAIHQGNATFSDGSLSGQTLTSNTANFTQADVGQIITGGGFPFLATHIQSWISPTQVTLDRPSLISLKTTFTIVGRRDGLVDVAMAAFPNQYISIAVGGDAGLLDLAAANLAGDDDPNTFLARTVGSMIQAAYPGRYITQQNSVSAVSPVEADSDGTTWTILAQAAEAGYLTAGQALGVCYNNEGYRMNRGDNCNHDDDTCVFPCDGLCALDYGQILEKSADRLYTYSGGPFPYVPCYYEIYQPDAAGLPDIVTIIHGLFNPSP